MACIKSMYDLYHGDCFEVMERLPAHSIDMVLCDLPYGCTRNEWDKPLNMQQLWPLYKRLVKSGGVIALFAKQKYTIKLGASNLKDFRYKIVWQKTSGTDFLNANRKPLSCHEDILIFYDKQPIYNPQKREGFKPYFRDHSNTRSRLSPNYGKNFNPSTVKINTDGRRYPIDVINHGICQQMGHSTAKPIDLLEWLIKTYTNEGMTILDNCMGSGSAGVAALNTGRRFIGIEKNQDFYSTAYKRIKQASSNLIQGLDA